MSRWVAGLSRTRVVRAVAPIRVCDIGGWTDTWFAEHGKVLNVAVTPNVEVRVRAHRPGALEDRIVLETENFGERYGFDPASLPDRHPLLEAVIDEIGIPGDASVEISVSSEAPVGGSTGTSAAVTVALIGALERLAGRVRTRHEIAEAAHRIEVERLGIQSGIQDQLCAAYGGINYIEMDAYPHASVIQLRLPASARSELERRLLVVFLGHPHVSSVMHERVIEELAHEGAGSARLESLRHAAERARHAMETADFAALGSAMTWNTEVQRRLHPDIVSPEAQVVIDVAIAHGATGWKLNGAGGDGGSVTILCGPDGRSTQALERALHEDDPRFEIVPTRLSPTGLRVWDSPTAPDPSPTALY